MTQPPDPNSDPSSPHPGQPGYGQPGYGPAGYGPGYGPGHGQPQPRQSNGAAIAALATGVGSVVLGLCCFLFSLLAPVAIVLGRRGQRRADDSGGLVGGRGMATAGFVLGIIGTVLLLLEAAWFAYVVARGGDLQFRVGDSS